MAAGPRRSGSHRPLRVLTAGLAFVGALGSTPPTVAAEAAADTAGELIAIGQQIYREGRLPSGEPLAAVVVGDVAVAGRQTACINCHQRSGLGASEGGTGALPTTGTVLYTARSSGYRPRPAYGDETLARAIRSGVDSGGTPLAPLMPRYRIEDRAMAGLIAYLKTLSREISPGVTDAEIHFATVLADGVDPLRRRAMLDVLETFVRDKNTETRAEGRRATHGPFFKEFKNKAYRKWVLHQWSLTGSPDTWRAQLENHYATRPVFAVLSGLAPGSWEPIHRFCETHAIPCMLPNTDLPAIADGEDFYTLYFSQGLILEARVAVLDLMRRAADAPAQRVLQVYRSGDGEGAAAARALHAAAAGSGGRLDVQDWILTGDGPPAGDALAQRAEEAAATATVLWVRRGDVASLTIAPSGGDGRRTAYLSSTLLGGDLSAVPPALRRIARIVHPYALPTELDERLRRVEVWLRSREIEVPDATRIQAQTYFACATAADGLMHVRRLFHRDFFLDSIDHAEGMARLSAFYPRLTFGPRQRYLSKGSYVVELAPDAPEPVIVRAEWITP